MHWLTDNLHEELFKFGDTTVTPLSLLIFTATVGITLLAARMMRRVVTRVISRRSAGEGMGYAIGRIVQYSVIVIGALLSLENVGISLTALAAAGAIVSVGIGFGLQNITQNFVSGIILLVERPIQRGDVLDVDGSVGKVLDIGMRATLVETIDGITVLVPNSLLISNQVKNLHAPNPVNRLRVRVGVAYGSDTALVRRVLTEVGENDARVLQRPKVEVFFEDFADSALIFELGVWLDDAILRRKVASDLRFAIDAAFRRHDIRIPFPQRDLHLKSGFPAREPAHEEPAPAEAEARAAS